MGDGLAAVSEVKVRSEAKGRINGVSPSSRDHRALVATRWKTLEVLAREARVLPAAILSVWSFRTCSHMIQRSSWIRKSLCIRVCCGECDTH